MRFLRTVTCGVCGQQYTETAHGEGWPGWGCVQGFVLDNEADPMLCPEHLVIMANFLDKLKHPNGE